MEVGEGVYLKAAGDLGRREGEKRQAVYNSRVVD